MLRRLGRILIESAMGDRLVVAKRMSGIGDMLLQAMHVLWYSRLSGRTAYFDWRNSL